MSGLFYRLNRRFGPLSKLSQDELLASRREAMKATLLASAGLLISGPSALAHMGRPPAGKRVVVVGAGFGGLACAYELLAAGYDVTVIDARNRVGGRVLSFNDIVPGKNVEGGGELIGSNHPTWVAYAEKFKLKFLDVAEDADLFAPIVIGGKVLDEETCNKVWEELDPALATANAMAEPIDAFEPWKTPGAKELDAQTVESWISQAEGDANLKAAMRAQLAGDNGVGCEQQSLLGLLAAIKGGGLEKYWSDSEVYRCDGGNQLLATKLAEGLGANRIVLKLPVTKIDTSKGVCVVTCADNRTLECDDVVLAVPPTTWGKIEIKPGIPTDMAPQLGVNVKYLAQVKKRFWLDAKRSGFSLSDTDISWTWESTDGQDTGDGPAGLTAFSGAAAAAAMRGTPAGERDAKYAEDMEVAQPGFKENFINARFMDWPGDQWTLGGYSCPKPGNLLTAGPKLRAGLGKLHFAGEHCSHAFPGYMEGALNSGVALAKRLAVRDGAAK
jgi:monoamine oxidase